MNAFETDRAIAVDRFLPVCIHVKDQLRHADIRSPLSAAAKRIICIVNRFLSLRNARRERIQHIDRLKERDHQIQQRKIVRIIPFRPRFCGALTHLLVFGIELFEHGVIANALADLIRSDRLIGFLEIRDQLLIALHLLGKEQMRCRTVIGAFQYLRRILVPIGFKKVLNCRPCLLRLGHRVQDRIPVGDLAGDIVVNIIGQDELRIRGLDLSVFVHISGRPLFIGQRVCIAR